MSLSVACLQILALHPYQQVQSNFYFPNYVPITKMITVADYDHDIQSCVTKTTYGIRTSEPNGTLNHRNEYTRSSGQQLSQDVENNRFLKPSAGNFDVVFVRPMPHSTFLTISRIDSYGTAKTDEDMPTPQQDHWDAWLKPGPIDDITTDGFVTKLTLSATTTGLTNDLKATWTMAPNSGTGNVHVFFGAPKPGVDTECKTKMFRFSNVSAREMSFEAQLPARAETYVAVVFERRTSGGKVRRYSAIRYLKR